MGHEAERVHSRIQRKGLICTCLKQFPRSCNVLRGPSRHDGADNLDAVNFYKIIAQEVNTNNYRVVMQHEGTELVM